MKTFRNTRMASMVNNKYWDISRKIGTLNKTLACKHKIGIKNQVVLARLQVKIGYPNAS
jgi:hypothetical protein